MSQIVENIKHQAGVQIAAKVAGPPIWQSGLCDCMEDSGICIQTFCCWICTETNMANKHDTGIGAFDCAACCGIMFANYAMNGYYDWYIAHGFRRAYIQRYGINEESGCKSCMMSICWPCSLCQVQREMGKRDEHAGGCCAKPPENNNSMADRAMGALKDNVVGALTGAGAIPPHPWGSGICGCNGPECCEGIFCYPCMFGFMQNKLDQGRVPEKPIGSPDQIDPLSCCGALWSPYGWMFANRREVVERYNVIGETHCQSCSMAICCTPCAACQQRREMGYNGEWPGGICVKECPPKQA